MEQVMLKEENYFHPQKLILYQNISTDPLINKTKELIDIINWESQNIFKRDQVFYYICSQLIKSAESYHWAGDLWEQYLSLLIIQAENAFSRSSAWYHGEKLDSAMMKIALHDMKQIKQIWDFDFRTLGDWVPLDLVDTLENFTHNFPYPGQMLDNHYRESMAALQTGLRDSVPEEMVGILKYFYHRIGYGKMGLFSSFYWHEGEGLRGIPFPDQIRLENLIGYEYQKRIVLDNIEAFVQGKKANNMLLYGERGTGKSSTIKALVNEYYTRGLRLLEVNKTQFGQLGEIMRTLRQYPQRFLIFIDDLSFENNETEYKHLKYILEGGMEVLPDNAVIYATSNRRHLVQENWHDREGEKGEVRTFDALSEKLSLADRFGVTVTFTSPDQEEYLKIVAGLAEQHGLDIPSTELRERALQWERWYNGRSGRTARQFIHNLLTKR